MKLPRDLTGEELIMHLCKHWGYERVHQVEATLFCKPSSQRLIGSRFRRTQLCGLEL
jgi:hypothetical protein